MEPFRVEATVDDDGSLLLSVVPFAPGTKLLVTLEDAEPMDRDAFDAALRLHYERT